METVPLELSDEAIDAETHVIAVTGEIDLATSPQLKASLDALVDRGVSNVVIDLTHVSHIDSMGFTVLVHGLRRIRDAKGVLATVCPDPIRRLFEMVGLNRMHPVCATREEALAAVRGA